MSLFIGLAILAALLAAGLVAVPLLRDPEQPAPVAATLAALVIPAMAALLYLAGSNYGWQPPVQASASSAGNAMAPELDAAIAGLEAKLGESPDDLPGWLLLGNSYLQVQRPADAETSVPARPGD